MKHILFILLLTFFSSFIYAANVPLHCPKSILITVKNIKDTSILPNGVSADELEKTQFKVLSSQVNSKKDLKSPVISLPLSYSQNVTCEYQLDDEENGLSASASIELLNTND